MSRNLKAIVTKNSFKERYRTSMSYLQKIKALVEDVCMNNILLMYLYQIKRFNVLRKLFCI